MLPETTAASPTCPLLTAPLERFNQDIDPETTFPLTIILSARSSLAIVPDAIKFVVILPELIWNVPIEPLAILPDTTALFPI